MISFKYHLVSIAAVLLALAAGVALGSGLLSKTVAADDSGSGSGADQGLVDFETGYAAATSPGLIDGKLDRRTVLILTIPGTSEKQVKAVRKDVESAGANITGQAALTKKLVDPGGRQFADSVAQEAAGDDKQVKAAGSAYQRVGAALGRATLGKGGDLDDASQTIRAAFTEGDLIKFGQEPKQQAGLVLVVGGADSPTDASAALSGILGALDAARDGAVLTGPAASSASGKLIAEVRQSDVADQVSTVDVLDTAAGRAVSVLALAQEADGQSGAWGTSRSADGALPK